MRNRWKSLVVTLGLLPLLGALGCGESFNPDKPVYDLANACFIVAQETPEGWHRLLNVTEDGAGYEFGGPRSFAEATRFFLKPSGLGTYLFYDDEGQYLVSDGEGIQRQAALQSDVSTIDDSFESPAEWEVFAAIEDDTVRLRHRKSGRYLTTVGLVDDRQDGAHTKLMGNKGCREFPEATLDASGEVQQTKFEDGSLYGIVDTHSHILSNFGFGGGGMFHGSPFHALGIEHALSDCELYHGENGRSDLFGFGFDNPGSITDFFLALLTGELPNDNHQTAGYPEFTDWPNAPKSSTHQVQYYRWLERAYLGGLRLVVQHATSNQIICDLTVGIGAQEVRYDCNDMVAVDRIVDETYAMQDYIDAQEGGPGEGWFRVVTTPSQARSVIEGGKMAVILGIETSNLFDCFLVPNGGFESCTEADVIARLDSYYARGVRALFPVHKYDNEFSAGDGHKGIIELGNFIQTGHTSNMVEECDPEFPGGFDSGRATFSGILEPRDDYFGPPPFDFSGFAADPLATLGPLLLSFLKPPTPTEVCQKAGMTDMGEFLMGQLMLRGMIIEVDHLPRKSYRRAFEILADNDYPAAGTHGRNNNGQIYALGGVSKTGFGTCRSASEPSTVDNGFQNRIQLIADMGGFPAEGFGFDLNGFAGARGPRFGPDANCGDPQADPITYPFESYAGDVTFTPPWVGNRPLDFNTEGLVHIGLLPELLQDIRGDGVTDEELEPLFKSAEGYIRMWEKAVARAEAMAP